MKNLIYRVSNNFGWPLSSRHMSRSEAAMVIRYNISHNCRFYRPKNDGNWDDTAYTFLEQIDKEVGHDIPFIQLNDGLFSKFMQLFGALYWDREYDRCIKGQRLNGTDSEPYYECVLRYSVILKPENMAGEYGIITDPCFLDNTIDDSTLHENLDIIDELDKSHNLVNLLVDGYMWAQGCERQVEKRYRNDPDKAYTYLLNKAFAQFGLTTKDIRVYHF